jgi:hypothetical protein
MITQSPPVRVLNCIFPLVENKTVRYLLFRNMLLLFCRSVVVLFTEESKSNFLSPLPIRLKCYPRGG